MALQYVPQRMKSRGVDRFAIIVSIGTAWALAEFLTAAGVFNKERSVKIQMTCFTNQSALITATPWSVSSSLFVLCNSFKSIFCVCDMIDDDIKGFKILS